MKKIILAAIILVVAASLLVAFGAKSRKKTAGKREWPMGLGRLDSVPSRYPKTARSPAAAELERLSGAAAASAAGPGSPAAGSGRRSTVPDPIASYVRSQLQRIDRTIDPAPPLHPNAAAIRTLLLSGQPIAWEADISRGSRAPIPNLNMLLKVSRLLTASALERARLGDAEAWDDLRAQRVISGGLWQRPEVISALVALAIDRNVIGAARKMPMPAPAWFAELRAFDHRKAALAAMQAETWALSSTIKEYSDGQDGAQNVLTRFRDRTLGEISRAEMVARQRETAARLAELPGCTLELDGPAAPWWGVQSVMSNTIGVWRRVFRFRAELELTEHVLGLRSGTQSQCSDGQWIVTPESVRFSKAIPIDGPAAVMPLEFKR